MSDESQRREEEEECQAEWTINTQPPETSTDPGAQLVLSPPRTDGADCSARSVLPSSQPLSQFQVKEEEAEVEIICIKQEPEEVETLLINLAAEGFNSQGNLLDRQTQGNLLLDSHRTIPGSQSQRDRRAPCPPQSQRTLAENTPFTSADSCSCELNLPRHGGSIIYSHVPRQNTALLWSLCFCSIKYNLSNLMECFFVLFILRWAVPGSDVHVRSCSQAHGASVAQGPESVRGV